jgi:hypothetical protein
MKEEIMKSFKNLVTVGAMVIGSFVGVANASQAIVFDQPLNNWDEEVSAGFGVNRELGRAWIEVGLRGRNLGEEATPETVVPKAVEGLYYDAARKQVLYRSGAETVVCAEDATFLLSTSLKSTGQCLLSPRTEQRKIDDGFNIREQSVAKVTFEAATATAAMAAKTVAK